MAFQLLSVHVIYPVVSVIYPGVSGVAFTVWGQFHIHYLL